jgi:diacylglycerol kinase family enzyme
MVSSFSVRRISSWRIASARVFHLASISTATSYVKYFTGMAFDRLRGMSGVTVVRADQVSISAANGRRAYVQIDGEIGGTLPAEIRIVPDALTLLAPKGYGE